MKRKNPELKKLRDRIHEILSAPGYRPLRLSELIGKLRIPPADRSEVRRIVDQLIREGVIVRVRKDRLILPSIADLVTGKIQMNERGFGFVVPEVSGPGEKPAPDVFIPAEDTGVAMHGDRVVVRLTEPSRVRREHQARPGMKANRIGKVIRILTRANPTLTGILQRSQHFHYLVPDDPRIGRDVYIDLTRSKVRAKMGERVVVKLDSWENRHINPEGVLVEVIGPADDPSLDIQVIVKKHRLRTEFPDDVLAEAGRVDDEVRASDHEGREDFTRDLVITIDPDDARDHDDALSLRKLRDGWELAVHIADVSHYVVPGSSLDSEARERGNSVYLPDRVIPMLPPRLSNGICSLKENVERLTKTVVFHIDRTGRVIDFRFCAGVIRSAARLTYRQVLPVIDPKATLKGPPPSPIEDAAILSLLRELWDVASRVRQLRFANGSLDLDFPELKVYCNDQGVPERVEKVENDISHQLVEECMLLANEAVAKEFRDRGIPSIYRIHEDPDPEKLEDFREQVLVAGQTMGDPTLRSEIQKLLKRLAGKPEEYLLKLNLLKSLKRAQYSATPVGHYGLAKENYTHFTSPIRRYADLVVHRTLNRLLDRPSNRGGRHSAKIPGYDVATLESIAGHCSITERIADEAEKEAVRLKLIEFFERSMKDQQLDQFEALITEVRNFGMIVELPEFMLSGMVRVSTMEDDFYEFDPSRHRLVGRKTKKLFQAGDKVHVAVSKVDRFKKQIDFMLSRDEEEERELPRREKPGSRRHRRR
jgi:ribonuclease R